MAKAKPSGLERYKDMLDAEGYDTPDNYFRAMYDKFHDKLSEDEDNAIFKYTGSTYEAINEYLREGKMGSGEDEYLENLIRNCDSGLSKFTFTENVIVSRKAGDEIFRELIRPDGTNGIKYNWDVDAFVKEVNDFKGSIIRDKGFVSTSTSRNVWSGNVWFEIQIPKGSNGAYVRPMSDHPSEREVILNRGTQFKIISARAEQTKHGGYRPIVTIQVIGRSTKG